MYQGSYNFDTIILSGGLSKNFLFCQILADVTQIPVIISDCQGMLFGCAVVGFTASNFYSSVLESMKKISENIETTTFKPNSKFASFHQKQYMVFLQMFEHQQLWHSLMYEES